MNANQEVERTLAHQASEWVTVLRRTATREELAAFAEWLKTSPRHVRDFLIMVAIEKELHGVDSQRKLAALDGDHTSSNVFALNAEAGVARPRSWNKRWGLAAAAALIALAVGVIAWQGDALTGHRYYETQVGEQRAVELADGSIVHL